jgi:hypothetical protein
MACALILEEAARRAVRALPNVAVGKKVKSQLDEIAADPVKSTTGYSMGQRLRDGMLEAPGQFYYYQITFTFLPEFSQVRGHRIQGDTSSGVH